MKSLILLLALDLVALATSSSYTYASDLLSQCQNGQIHSLTVNGNLSRDICNKLKDPSSVRTLDIVFGHRHLQCGDLHKFENLERLRLWQPTRGEILDCHFKGLKKLNELELNSLVFFLSEDAFLNLPNLKILKIGHRISTTHLPNLKRTHFRDLTKLETLTLSVDLSTPLADDLTADLSNLRSLTISGYDVSGSLANLLRPLSNLTELYLALRANTSIPDQAFNNQNALKKLTIGYSAISTLNRAHFQPLASLEQLILVGNERLADLPGDLFVDLLNLAQLHISGSPLESLPEKLFYPLSNLIVLKVDSPILQFIPDYSFINQKQLRHLSFGKSPLKQTKKSALYGLGSDTVIELPPSFDLDGDLHDWGRN